MVKSRHGGVRGWREGLDRCRRSVSQRFRGAVLAAVFTTPLVSGCGTSPAADRQSVLTVVQSSVSIGDPHIVSDALGPRSIKSAIYEALVKLDAQGRAMGPLGGRAKLDLPLA